MSKEDFFDDDVWSQICVMESNPQQPMSDKILELFKRYNISKQMKRVVKTKSLSGFNLFGHLFVYYLAHSTFLTPPQP